MVISMTLAHDEAGHGPTVVLLHSTAADRRMWDPQMPVLASAGLRALRCDFRGFGETPAPDRPYDDAQDVLDLLDRLDIGRFDLIASSGGGAVALEIAARWPSRVTALALLCTALPGHERGPELRAFSDREDALLAAGDIAGATELNVQTWLGPHADEQTRAAVRAQQRHAFEVQTAAPDVESTSPGFDVSAITAPALLISGAHDLADFREIAASLAGRVPGARHVELAWAGHLPSVERPDLVNPMLLDFLTGSGGR
jgi:pimeloyl-ACP methyl ester carboxylesterase